MKLWIKPYLRHVHELNKNAPRIVQISIPTDKIGTVIGPGGKQIRELEAYGAQIEIGEDGTIKIFSSDGEAAEKVRSAIEGMTKGVEVGGIYEGKVAKLMDFGAFINLIPGSDGLLHISQISETRIEKVSDALKEGDRITVKVVGIDGRGKIDLVRPELEGKVAPRKPKEDRPRGSFDRDRGGSDRGGIDRGGTLTGVDAVATEVVTALDPLVIVLEAIVAATDLDVINYSVTPDPTNPKLMMT